MDWTGPLSIWGGVTGSLALLVTFLTYRRDRAHLRVSCSAGMIISETTSTGPWIFLEAVNAGRRSIRLQSAGFLAEGAPHDALVTFGDLHTFPTTLGEGENVSVHVLPTSLFEHSIGAGRGRPTVAYFRDSLGKEHKTRVPPGVLAKVSALGDVNAKS
jgi:hypothetical protein